MFTRTLAVAFGLSVAAALPAQDQEKTSKQDVKAAVKAAQTAFDSQDWKAAATAYKKVVTIDPENAIGWHHLGYSLHALGQYDAALKAHKKAATFPETAQTGTYNVACVYAIRGEKDAAFEWLGKALEAGFARSDAIVGDPDMDNLRDDPRFDAFLSRVANYEPDVQVFSMTTPRASTRLSFWGESGSPGQVAIDYGQPTWRDEFGEKLESEQLVNRRWRLGKDFWTTLDTNVPLTLGGEKVAAGQYYLTLELRDDGKFVLALNEPKTVRAKTLDAYLAHYTKGGIEIEMDHREIDEVAEKLTFALKVKEKSTSGKMVIAFGPHALTAPIEVHLGGKKKKQKTDY